jgi:hypothetical protein
MTQNAPPAPTHALTHLPPLPPARTQWVRPPKSKEDEGSNDMLLSLAPMAASVGLYFKVSCSAWGAQEAGAAALTPLRPAPSPPPPQIRYFCWAAVIMCLLSLGQRRGDSFNWSSFATALA